MVPGARPAGAPAPLLPPAFTTHHVPPSVPGRHGAAASAQEVTNSGSREKEGGGAGGRGRGRWGRLGRRTATPVSDCRARAGRAGRREAVPSAGRQFRAPGRVCPQAEGARGEAEPRLSREPGLAAWKVSGQCGAPRGRTPGPADFSLLASSRSPEMQNWEIN